MWIDPALPIAVDVQVRLDVTDVTPCRRNDLQAPADPSTTAEALFEDLNHGGSRAPSPAVVRVWFTLVRLKIQKFPGAGAGVVAAFRLTCA